MKFKEIIGIDVSKLSLEVHLHLNKASAAFSNDSDGIIKLLGWCEKHSGLKKEALFFVFEHTGLYSHQLACMLTQLGMAYIMESGLEVKRSLGITRGKDDAIDAKKLAQYGYRRREELTPYELADTEIQQLQGLLKLRDRLVKQRAGYKTSLQEQKRVLEATDYLILFDVQNQLVQQLSSHIKTIEAQIKAIVKASL